MPVAYRNDIVTLLHGDALDELRALPDASVHAVVTDPPYGLGFMGREWDQLGFITAANVRVDTRPLSAGPVGIDHRTTRESSASMHAGEYDLSSTGMIGFERWCTLWATECLRVLKPGGHLLAFGGSRTWHRLSAGVEDAGFEIRDSIAWLHGQGMPKSLDVGKAIDRAAGAVREVVGKHPSPASSIFSQGLTRMSADVDLTIPATAAARHWDGWGTGLKPSFDPIVVARKPMQGTTAQSVQRHGTGAPNIDATRVEAVEGEATDRSMDDLGRWPTNVVIDESAADEIDRQTGTVGANGGGQPGPAGRFGDAARTPSEGPASRSKGSASRFFPTFRYEAKAPASERPIVDGEQHATVKPLALMRWLVRLVTPEGGIVLEPFAGSGTTVEACLREGRSCIAIEREATYLPMIIRRVQKDHQQSLFDEWEGVS